MNDFGLKLATEDPDELLGAMEEGERGAAATPPRPALRKAFRLLDHRELLALPEPEWLVHNAIPEKASVALVGPTKQYKSFVAIDLAAHVSLGLEWQGRKVRPGRVVYVAGEGAAGMRKRLQAWAAFNGAEPDVLVLPHSLDFGTREEVDQLLAAIAARIEDGRLALLVIDTLNRCMIGDENTSEYVARFMASCDAVREATGATVFTVHHTGHTAEARPRGSSAFPAAMDAVFLCAQANGGDRVELKCDKQKDGIDGWTVEFEILPCAQSMVLKPSGVTSQKLTGQRLSALLVLHQEFGAEGATSKDWQDATGIEADSSFHKVRKWLDTQRYVRHRSKRYVVSDEGKLALSALSNSTRSTDTPPTLHSAIPTPLHSVGVYRDPTVEQGQSEEGG